METNRLATFLDYLRSVHGRTRRVVLCIPPADLEWAAGPGRFTFGDLVRHLAGIERYMYAETVHGRQSRYPGHGTDLADGYEATLAYYDRLHEESVALFGALTEARLDDKCLTPAGTPITVWKWLRAHVEHEAHHRGQLYLMLGLRSVPTPPLYGLTSEEVRVRSRDDMLSVDIDGKRFVTTGNPHGVSGAETIFEYRTDGRRITGTYQGGRIADGHVIGKATGPDTIELLYHCVTTDGELLAGSSRGRVSRNARGLVELHFEWAWLTGDRSGGHSCYIELANEAGDDRG